MTEQPEFEPSEFERPDFERHWMDTSPGELDGGSFKDAAGLPDLPAIREYVYQAFDHLDKNGNGFLEKSELIEALKSQIPRREKSFIVFLLNNQENIAEAVEEEAAGPADGISRQDLESYFAIVAELLC